MFPVCEISTGALVVSIEKPVAPEMLNTVEAFAIVVGSSVAPAGTTNGTSM